MTGYGTGGLGPQLMQVKQLQLSRNCPNLALNDLDGDARICAAGARQL